MDDTFPQEAACLLLAFGRSVEYIAEVLDIDPCAIAPMLDAPAPALVVLGAEAAMYIGHPLPCDA